MILADLICEASRRERDGLHLCGKPAGHAGDHVCATFDLCRITWARVDVVRSEHLGPCARCGEVVRPLGECSTCLEDDGVVRHADCCDD